jgi:hypothetical protein
MALNQGLFNRGFRGWARIADAFIRDLRDIRGFLLQKNLSKRHSPSGVAAGGGLVEEASLLNPFVFQGRERGRFPIATRPLASFRHF